MSSKYTVSVTYFAERYFIKKFQKKYKRAWDITREALIKQLQNVDILFARSMAEVITSHESIKICKIEFSVAGTKKSRHSSGNRYIIAINTKEKNISVLLVYYKNHLGNGNETANWKKMIKNNYAEYSYLM
jgi:hypothetical protein